MERLFGGVAVNMAEEHFCMNFYLFICFRGNLQNLKVHSCFSCIFCTSREGLVWCVWQLVFVIQSFQAFKMNGKQCILCPSKMPFIKHIKLNVNCAERKHEWIEVVSRLLNFMRTSQAAEKLFALLEHWRSLDVACERLANVPFGNSPFTQAKSQQNVALASI